MCTHASQAVKLEVKVEITPPQTCRKATTQNDCVPSCKPAACGDRRRPPILLLTIPNIVDPQRTKLGTLLKEERVKKDNE
jgi:hypothetical protein